MTGSDAEIHSPDDEAGHGRSGADAAEPRPRALVTGATGALGPSVVAELRAAGFQVRTLSLDEPGPGVLPGDVERVVGDINDATAVAAAVESCEVVVHMAALLHVFESTPEMHRQYELVNVAGTAVVVAKAAKAHVGRVVLFSTIAVYGHSGADPITEDSPARPETMYAESKLASEQVVLAARRADGRPLGTVLRLAAAYGPRVKGNYLRLLRSLAHRRFVSLGRGGNRRTLVYDADVARAAVVAARDSSAAGCVFNVTDGRVHTVRGVIEAMCAALGRRPPRFSVPVGPARVAAGLVEKVAGTVGVKAPVTRSAIDKFTEDVAVDGSRFQRELGFRPAYDLERGWRETVATMRRAGEL